MPCCAAPGYAETQPMWTTMQTYFTGLATRWTSLGTSFRDWWTRRSIDGDHIIDVITSAAVLPVLAALSVCAVWIAVMLTAHVPVWLWVLTTPVIGAAAVIAFIWTFEKTR